MLEFVLLAYFFSGPVAMSLVSRHTRWGRVNRHPEHAEASVFVWRSVIVSSVLWIGYPLLIGVTLLGFSVWPMLWMLPIAALAWWLVGLGGTQTPQSAAYKRTVRGWFGGLLGVLAAAVLVHLVSMLLVFMGYTQSLAPLHWLGALGALVALVHQVGAWFFTLPPFQRSLPETASAEVGERASSGVAHEPLGVAGTGRARAAEGA